MLVFRNSSSRVLNHNNWWFETPKVDAAEDKFSSFDEAEFEDICLQGGIVTFNLRRPTGDYVGFTEVWYLALMRWNIVCLQNNRNKLSLMIESCGVLFSVEEIANLNGILIRTGCFCNTGACQNYLKLSNEDLMKNFKYVKRKLFTMFGKIWNYLSEMILVYVEFEENASKITPVAMKTEI
ncbi:Molybdenum cofactor sulfurase 3 [Nymphon striatum]|nr:Molybdenum cofactor sulfurase 3 [Nymphon striatum]